MPLPVARINREHQGRSDAKVHRVSQFLKIPRQVFDPRGKRTERLHVSLVTIVVPGPAAAINREYQKHRGRSDPKVHRVAHLLNTPHRTQRVEQVSMAALHPLPEFKNQMVEIVYHVNLLGRA